MGGVCCSARPNDKPKVAKRKGKMRKQAKDDIFARYPGVHRPEVEHIFVLSLSSRSFDNVFGVFMDRRYAAKEIEPSRWDEQAKAGKSLFDYTNTVKAKDGQSYEMPVWGMDPKNEEIMSARALSIPNGAVVEKYVLLNRCVFEQDNPRAGSKATLGGFAQEYYNQEMYDKDTYGEDCADKTDFTKFRSPAMHVYLPEQMHVFTELATAFGLSDTYFSSAPCQTWPNRMFMHCGHCYGYVDNTANAGEPYAKVSEMNDDTKLRLQQFSDETIFSKLVQNDVEFAIYHGDLSMSTLLHSELHSPLGFKRAYSYSKCFARHMEDGQAAPYAVIEPQFLASDDVPSNDMHSSQNTLLAQELVADVFKAIRSNDTVWRHSVLFVIFDQGVGLFDHVVPPTAPDPAKGYDHPPGFIKQEDPRQMSWNPFTRYGTRVPCLIATPFLKPGAVVRPDPQFSQLPFDHCSIIRTVFDLFVGTGVFLTERDRTAPSFVPSFLRWCREYLGPNDIRHPSPRPEPQVNTDEGLDHRSKLHNARILVDHSETLEEGQAKVAMIEMKRRKDLVTVSHVEVVEEWHYEDGGLEEEQSPATGGTVERPTSPKDDGVTASEGQAVAAETSDHRVYRRIVHTVEKDEAGNVVKETVNETAETLDTQKNEAATAVKEQANEAAETLNAQKGEPGTAKEELAK